jgi:hypothetical protein
MNIIIADTIHYLNIVLVFYVLTGWIITPVRKIHYYILFVIFVLLDWNDLDGECFLTRLEHYFREKARNGSSSYGNGNGNGNGNDDEKLTISTETGDPEFFRPLMNRLFNTNLNSQEASRLNYFTFISAILLAFLRMLHHYNIMNFGMNFSLNRLL